MDFNWLTRGGDIDPTKIPGLQVAQWRHGLWYTTPGVHAAAALGNDQIRYTPFWVPPGGVNIDRAGTPVTVVGEAASTLRLGFFLDDGTGLPGSLLADFGTVSGATTTFSPITVAQSLPGGLIWSAVFCQNAPTTAPTCDVVQGMQMGVGMSTPASGAGGSCYSQSLAGGGAFPAQATPVAGTLNAGTRIFVRAV